MTHLSENSHRLTINQVQEEHFPIGFSDVGLILLPFESTVKQPDYQENLKRLIRDEVKSLREEATLIVLGEAYDLVHVHAALEGLMTYQVWTAIKRDQPKCKPDHTALPENHFSAVIYTKYTGSLNHTITRIQYTYCPACDKTTKDYGGKKHTYNTYGTLLSDVWRDITGDLDGSLDAVIERFADLFGLETYQELRVLDWRQRFDPIDEATPDYAEPPPGYLTQTNLFALPQPVDRESRLVLGDCLENLRSIPDESVDFAFIDPPYNLKKKYNSYADDLSVQEYFAWCDEWIAEVARILRPGCTVAILNIPLWAIRHFLFMETILRFQNWIAWDALSFPVRMIMPAHYAIVCFTKGTPRPLPGLIGQANALPIPQTASIFQPLEPLAEGYCLRSSCVQQRKTLGLTDRGVLIDLWWDIHRLKHNSRRVDHPCQLPPQLLYRLISLFTEPGEMVLDCFNGAGTTTLAAHQLGRKYLGIEFSEKYFAIAQSRHEEIRQGFDPFRKEQRELTEKNSTVERMPTIRYEVPKKTLQLEVRRVAQALGKLPSRQEMIQHGSYPIRYYDEYFASWGEVCAAARHNGMSEERTPHQPPTNGAPEVIQLSFFGRGDRNARR